jgi:putative chitinase
MNRAAFFDGWRSQFGALTQDLVDALDFRLDKIEQHPQTGRTPRRMTAYVLATIKWETAHTMRPIDEHGGDEYFERRYGAHTALGRRLGNVHPGDGARFHGRGDVQLTGLANYKKAGEALGIDLLEHPSLAKEPDIAWAIAVRGMTIGWFTGRRLADYFKDAGLPDWEGARRIINGTDHAADVARIARKMDEILVLAL